MDQIKFIIIIEKKTIKDKIVVIKTLTKGQRTKIKN
jgi:histidyl-tRNA synthetase